jgi:hypothetical protein
LRLRFDKATSFDLNFNGQPVEMSLNPRKCNSKARNQTDLLAKINNAKQKLGLRG